MAHDVFGTKLKIGDIITYITTKYRKACLGKAIIRNICDNQTIVIEDIQTHIFKTLYVPHRRIKG